MKKTVLALAIAIAAFDIFSAKINVDYDMPDFADAFVFDKNISAETFSNESAQELIRGGFSDVRIWNYTSRQNLALSLYVHIPSDNEAGCVLLGDYALKGFGDKSGLKKKSSKLGKHRYFAIEPKANAPSSFSYRIFKRGKSLCVHIRDAGDDLAREPLPKHAAPNAHIFSKKDLPDDAEENIVFANSTSDALLNFLFFAWNKKRSDWDMVGAASVSAGNKMKIDLGDKNMEISDWDYYAIVPNTGKKYNYHFYERMSDLYVDVMDTSPFW